MRRIITAVILSTAILAATASADAIDEKWLTTAERTGFRETARYDETIDLCRRLANASDKVHLTTFGKTGEGRDLALLIVSGGEHFTPKAARDAGDLIVLVQNGIHAGEIEGKDASLMLARDMVITGEQAALLDGITVLIIPVFNVDGHERAGPYNRINQNGPANMGWRTTARNLNLNRDFMKADAIEMRAWLALWNEWLPDLHFDNHTTNGSEHRYDLLYTWSDGPAAPPTIDQWLNRTLAPELLPALEAAGHLPIRYFGMVDSYNVAAGIRSDGDFPPRFSTGYGLLRNRPSILVETHMSKPYETRVRATYAIMRETLAIAGPERAALRAANREADATAATLAARGEPVVIRMESTDTTENIVYKGVRTAHELSAVSGAMRLIYTDEPLDTPSSHFLTSRIAETVVPPPGGYIIPPQWDDVIDLLTAHGIRTSRLREPITAEFDSYRFENVTWATRPFEGRFRADFKAVPIRERRTYPTGSVVVPLDQPTSKVIVHLLEPAAPDSLVRWGFFNAIFEQKEYGEDYVLEDLARQMLAENAELRAAFEQKLRTDTKFAGDARARLNFFYERSPYWDARKDKYPIARLSAMPPASKLASE